MLFNSLEFLVFLPIVFSLYWLLRNSVRWQNLLVIIVSYIFYGWWNYNFLFLIALTTFCSYASGIQVDVCKSQCGKKAITIGNIVLNLGILGVYKYYNFFADSFQEMLNGFGIAADWPVLNLVLPVGISFYTFQALSYTIDVYKKKIEPTRDVLSFFAFISFFPQLVAGPIERATNLLPQFQKSRHFDYAQAVDGCRQMLWGFFKKMVIADNCAFFVNQIFDSPEQHGTWGLLAGAVLFSIQIYGDFSGYSDIAIGCARLFGINLRANFKFPYFSRNIAEFWRRWHISLNKWFVDYVYIPLGGSRVSKIKIIRNTWVIFLLSGLWHGANWTFVIWGAIHAALFMPLLIAGKNRQYMDTVAAGKRLPSVKETGLMLTNFIVVMFAWIFFRSDNFTEAIDYILSMCSFSNLAIDPLLLSKRFMLLAVFICLFFSMEWIQREGEHGLSRVPQSRLLRTTLYLAIFYLIMWFGGAQADFIYFQF